tara:strand:- start:4597 stop:5001 length:405 start_codon:yes stop_codon:yes gene_type:complete
MPKKKSGKKAKKSIKSTKAKGLGDTVEKVLEKTGIAKIAKWVLGEDCGCDERKEKLNKLFPYKKPECLTENEFIYLDKYFTEAKSTVHPKTQEKLLKIGNRIFHQKMSMTSCTSCFKKNLHDQLYKVYKEYNND